MNLGLIGYSKDNGHPFSFSAIINGYNRDNIHLNPVTPINDYLLIQPKVMFGIGNFKVTHVWTQDKVISTAISLYANINTIVEDYIQMVDEVDGLLILRDDMHMDIAAPFLKKGKFVFIDKPLATQSEEIEFFKPYLESGHLMSCSGLRFFPEIVKLKESFNEVSKELKFAYCTTVNNWFNYGIHSIEGLMLITGGDFEYIQYSGNSEVNQYVIMYKSGFYLLVNLVNGYNGGIRSHIYCRTREPIQVYFNDNFNSFRNTMMEFHKQVVTGIPAIPPQQTMAIMKLLMAGAQSYKLNGKKIFLNEE